MSATTGSSQSTARRGPEILTIGHSTHERERFASLLAANDMALLADVRAHPGSRRVPHAAREALREWLPAAGIDYLHLPELGGRRRPRADSPNGGWRSAGFRAYADHMATPEFEEALGRLDGHARRRRTAVMCAEGLWWQCHRRLVADALMVRGWRVVHVLPGGGTAPHELTPFAVVDGIRIAYPPEQGALQV